MQKTISLLSNSNNVISTCKFTTAILVTSRPEEMEWTAAIKLENKITKKKKPSRSGKIPTAFRYFTKSFSRVREKKNTKQKTINARAMRQG